MPFLTYDEAVQIALRKKAFNTKTVVRLSFGHHSIDRQNMILQSLSIPSIGKVLYNELQNSYIININSGSREDAKIWPLSAVTSWILVRPIDLHQEDASLSTMQSATLLNSLLATINLPINTIKEMHSDLEVQTKLIAKAQEKLGTWEPYEGKTITN